MRVIDADKLKHELIMGHDLVGAKYTDLAETVEAIPKEWIKKWISKRNDFPTMPYNQHIWNMLDDWEKENEIDRR